MHTSVVNPRSTLQPSLRHQYYDTHRNRRTLHKVGTPRPRVKWSIHEHLSRFIAQKKRESKHPGHGHQTKSSKEIQLKA